MRDQMSDKCRKIVPEFHCSIVPRIQCSRVPEFQSSRVPVFQWFSVPRFQCSPENYKIYAVSNYHFFSFLYSERIYIFELNFLFLRYDTLFARP
jgi:hypothetical protein